MLSEGVKSALKGESKGLLNWEADLNRCKRYLNGEMSNNVFEEYRKKWGEEEFKKYLKEKIEEKTEVVNYLWDWHEKNPGKAIINYHPSIEKEIDSNYGKQNLNFEIIMSVLVIIFLFILLRKR